MQEDYKSKQNKKQNAELQLIDLIYEKKLHNILQKPCKIVQYTYIFLCDIFVLSNIIF